MYHGGLKGTKRAAGKDESPRRLAISRPHPKRHRQPITENTGSEILTILLELWTLKHVRLRGIQVRESMSIGHTGTSGSSARGHSTHHRTCLADLRSVRRRYAGMHLLSHAGAWVSVWMLRGHWVARRKSMLGHALVGRERLRHHHC